MLIKSPPRWALREADVTPKHLYLNRREMIGATGIALASIALPQVALAKKYRDAPRSIYSTDEDPTPLRDVTGYNNFYEFGTDKTDPAKYAHKMTTTPWTIEALGHCDKPGVYNIEDLLAGQTIEERIYRLRCVETWSMVVPWNGFPMADLLNQFAPNSKAKFVQFETLYRPREMRGVRRKVLDWPYVEGLRMDEAMHPLTLAAVGLYGDTLPNQNGAPIRLVVPWKYGFKSIKSIVRIRFTEAMPRTSWNDSEPSEYGFYANVNPHVSHPRWSQRSERRIGDFLRRRTIKFNGYGEEVASLYEGMDLKKYY